MGLAVLIGALVVLFLVADTVVLVLVFRRATRRSAGRTNSSAADGPAERW